MRIQYWASTSGNLSKRHFSVTGEGSIEEECYEDAKEKVKNEYPFGTNINLQKVAIIQK